VQLTVGGLVLDTVVSGPADGPVVLLLHGFPQTSHSWRWIAPGLVEVGYRVVAPNQRGYSPGGRPAGIEAYRLPALVDDALGVLDAIGARTAHVVGHDWGAAVAWQLAARHPDRVRSLTAVSVPHPLAFVDGPAREVQLHAGFRPPGLRRRVARPRRCRASVVLQRR